MRTRQKREAQEKTPSMAAKKDIARLVPMATTTMTRRRRRGVNERDQTSIPRCNR